MTGPVAPLVASLLVAAGLVGPPMPDGPDVWFGPTVANAGQLSDHADRSRSAPSLVATDVRLPLDDADRADLVELATAAARSGTVVVLDVGPAEPVPSPAAAADLAGVVRRLERDRGTEFLVRHVGEASGFRTLATALHDGSDAATVWELAAGSTWPGDEAVDWVGVTLGPGDHGALPPQVGRVTATGRPVLLDARATDAPAVLELVATDDRVAAVTFDEPLARDARRRLLATDRARLAPVYEAGDRDADLVTRQPAGPAPGADPVLDTRASPTGWWWLGNGVLLVLALVVGLLRPRWLDVDDLRDPRADVVRGSVVLGSAVGLLLTLGVGLGSLPGWLVVGGVGTALALSGCAHRLSEWPVDEARASPVVVPRHLRRAALLVLAAVVLSALHVLLDAVPGVSSPFVTAADGTGLLQGPPAPGAVLDLLLLRLAPGPVMLLGLVACLAAAATVLGGQCRRGRGWVLLTASWLLFAVGLRTGWELPGVDWETGWPLLVWQLPFVHGFVLTDLLLAHPGRGRRLALTGVGVAGLGATGWGALVLVGLAPSTQPAVLVALLSAATVAAVTCCAWRPVDRVLGPTAVVGRHPLVATGVLVLAVVAVASV